MKHTVKVLQMEPVAQAVEVALAPSQERQRQLAELLLPHELLVEKLWERAAIPDSLVHIALDMSDAYWQGLKESGEAPPRIEIGGLRYVLTSDLRAWLQQRPKTMATKKRRLPTRNKKSDEHAAQPARTAAQAR